MPSSEPRGPAIRQAVLDWLDDNYHFGEAAEKITSDDMSFLKGGILDSLGFVQLVLHLEKTYGIRINRKELTPANFDSMGKIVGYLASHPELAAQG